MENEEIFEGSILFENTNVVINEKEINNLDKDPLINDSLKLYLRDIGNKPLLTREEEIELVKKIQNGDLEAKKTLIERNLRLVIWRAKKYIGRGLPLSDIIQEGNLGLIKATLKYDLSFNTKFSTYAVLWIEQSIRRAINEKGRTIRLPVHVHESLSHINKVEAKLVLKLNREPTYEEIANELNNTISVERIKELKLYTQDTVSLDMPLNDDKDFNILDVISDDKLDSPSEKARKNIQNIALYRSISKLKEKEQFVIKLKYGLYDGNCYTLNEISKILNVSRERVRQIQAKALFHLKRLPNTLDNEE